MQTDRKKNSTDFRLQLDNNSNKTNIDRAFTWHQTYKEICQFSDCEAFDLNSAAFWRSFSDAVDSSSNLADSDLSGKALMFNSVSLFVIGVQIPWMLGLSVCQYLRRRTAFCPDWERRSLTHSWISSSLKLFTYCWCTSPFTVMTEKDTRQLVSD